MHANPVPILTLDPELGRLLRPERRAAVQRSLEARVCEVAPGPWDASRLIGAERGHLGFLIVDGILAREVSRGDDVACELLGPRDAIRPAQPGRPGERWTVLTAAYLAVLDARFARALTHVPEVDAQLAARSAVQTQRLAATQSIARLRGVDFRLLALFWHFAERWGERGERGIALSLPLSHRLLAQLVGARRLAVSTALASLGHDGYLVREGQTWLLAHDAPGRTAALAAALVGRRAHRAVRPIEPPLGPEAWHELQEWCAAAHATTDRLRGESTVLRASVAEARGRRAAARRARAHLRRA